MATYELTALARAPQSAGPPLLAEIGPIVAPTLTWTRELNRPGSVSFSCTPDALAEDIKLRLLDPVATPIEVLLYRDGEPLMPAFVAGYQIQGEQRGTLSVTAPGLLGYLAYMWVDDDLAFTGVDQTLIGKRLVDQWQDLPYGHYGIDTSTVTASGVLRDRTYDAAEQHQVDQRLYELGATDDGFDVDLDPATRRLLLVHPRQGADLSASVFLDGRNITDSGVVLSVAPGDIASEAYGTSSDGETVLTSVQSNPALRQTWGRAGVAESYSGISEQATLDGHTRDLLNSRGAALFTPGPGLYPVDGADVGDFDIGDLVSFEYDSGLGVQAGVFRVASLQVSVDEDGAESMAVSFA